ncbi:hypothetical protein DNTS_023646 [Danionella cerebrum]|uniref:C2H2-type domain-containing protein n=1 Tax=Danionella cerebrum TaxID=2873325 RepID=A0A553QY75_9TELE|nr:hypothetical protein DNTS_023646 [Danionella translucida]
MQLDDVCPACTEPSGAESVLREQEKNWPCYECNRRFMSSEQLQEHLNMHDDKLNIIQRFGHIKLPVDLIEHIMDLLTSVDKLPFDERIDGSLNGLKVVEMAAETMDTETDEALDPVPIHSDTLQEEGDSVTPPPATEIPEAGKDDLPQMSPEDLHLTPQDMKRARRIRVGISSDLHTRLSAL